MVVNCADACQRRALVLPSVNVSTSSLRSTKIMPRAKECPMCGTTMRIKRTEQILRVPGNPRPTTRSSTEWICPECDYFEEAEEDRV